MKGSIFELMQAAAALCNRRRDTVYYSLSATGAAVLAAATHHPGMAPQYMALAVTLREGIRTVSWFRDSGLGRETSAAGLTFLASAAAATTMHAITGKVSREHLGIAFGEGIMTAVLSASSELGPRQIARLYRGKLFDYPDKKAPTPG
ncbi:MAG: hypothetical protein WDO70_05880 [Alphaproteobacteria bacterium]